MSLVLSLFSVFLWIFVVRGQYYELNTTHMWTEASKLCNFAAPPVSNSGYLDDFNYQLNSQEVWVGYFKLMTVFEYVGCTSIGSAQSIEVDHNTLGSCYTECKINRKQYIGLTETKCYCLNDPFKGGVTKDKCNHECGSTSIACGRGSHMAVYKVIMNATVPVDPDHQDYDSGDCLRYESIANVSSLLFNWRSCADPLRTTCENAGEVHYVDDGMYKPWYQSMSIYLAKCGKPKTLEEIKKLKILKLIGPSWTSVIRNSEIYKLKDMVASGSYKKQYGYLSKTISGPVLRFTDDDSSNKAVLCYNDITKSTDKSSTISTLITSTSKELEHTSTSADSNGLTNEDVVSQRGSDTTAIASATVVSVMVVIAVAAVVVIIKRRQKNPSLCKRTQTAKESHYDRPNDQASHEINSYDHHVEVNDNDTDHASESNYAHTYFVLDEHDRESNTDDTNDASGAVMKNKDIEDRVYNTLNVDSKETYDHLHNTRRVFNESENTYDTAEKAAMGLQAKTGQDLDNFVETDEDAYNHITSKPVKNANTENDYNVTNTLENAYGDILAHNKNNNHDEGDTYSHINSI